MTNPLARPTAVAFRPVVDHKSLAVRIPEPRPTPALDIVKSSDPSNPREIICREAIGPELARAAKELAYAQGDQSLYSQVLTNAVALRVLGIDTLEETNRVNNELFEKENFGNLEEASQLIRSLRQDMRKLTNKYNPGNPKILEYYMTWKPNMIEKLRGIKSVGQLIMDDIMPLKAQMSAIEKEAAKQLEQLDDTLAYYDQMLELSENEVRNLMYAIAVMEFILQRATEELAAMPEDPSTPFNNDRDRLARFVRDMDTKINDFKARLWLDAANAPRIMDMQNITQSVALRMVAVIQLVIPSMKGAIVDWSKTANSVTAARFIGEVTDTFNEVVQAGAAATSAAVPIMLRATETPMLSVETVHALGKMYEDVASAIETEVALGTQRKTELRQAQAEVLGTIIDAKERISDTYVKAALEAGNVASSDTLVSVDDIQLPVS